MALKIFEKTEAEATIKITPGVTYSKPISPSIGQGTDKNNLTIEEFEDMVERKRRTGIAEPPTR